MRAFGRGDVVMVVARHERVLRVALRQFYGAQQVARIRLAHAETVPAAHGHKPVFQIQHLENMPCGGHRLVGAYGHVPAGRAQAFQHPDRAGKGAGQVGGMRCVIGHVACGGLGAVNPGGGRARMGQQAANKGAHAIADHGADLLGVYGR